MIEPTPKPIPHRDNAQLRQPVGTIYPDAVPIVIHEHVLESILEYSEGDLERERGGFLLGGLHVDGRQYIEVRNFLPALEAESHKASLVFTHDTWSRFHQQAAEKFPDDVLVGWHHTHPDFGVFFSGYDLFIHRHFFAEPWQIAMVVDPNRQEFVFYQWREDDIVQCGFICIHDSDAATEATASD